MRRRFRHVRGVVWFAVLAAVVSLAFAGSASAFAGSIAPSSSGNELDCNGWSPKYPAARPAMRTLCTDPIQIDGYGETYRFNDNGHYVGHDEPSVKFISSTAGSGNTMTYYMKLPVDPTAAPTANGSVTDYAELSVAPWFGLPICDQRSYPQNPCTPDSDNNSGSISDAKGAGSAFMELQFYPPGITPFLDADGCSATQWCSALNIDSLECTFNFANCNGNCEEPVNFAYLQVNGVPAGSPAPQNPSLGTWFGNDQTLKMNPGDVLRVSISDPSGGLTTTVDDLTTGLTGTMQASASNGFADTNISDCSGTPHTFHAEYSTAEQQNQVPWAAAEGGVLMEQEIGHFESCGSVVNADPVSETESDGTYSDANSFDSCHGGIEGVNATGEGPCNPDPNVATCSNSTTQGFNGPTACPSNLWTDFALCEYADGYCFQAGERTVTIGSTQATESSLLNGCFDSRYQNGDLDWEGNDYQAFSWPNGGANVPTPFRYLGPFTADGNPYPQVQFETDAPGSEALCNVGTGQDCTVPPINAAFYPFFSLNYTQTIAGSGSPTGACVWNFGNDIAGVTNNGFGGDAEYGSSDVARYGGTSASPILTNPATLQGCGAPVSNSAPPTISGAAQQGQTLTESHTSWSNGSTSYSYQWEDCDASGNNCSLIIGATAQTYVPTASDVGQTIRVQEDVPGAGGTMGRATSSQTAVVVGAPPAKVSPPTISGDTTQGQTLTESHGTYTNSPTSFTYQWEDCDTFGQSCSPINGANAQTYTLGSSDVGKTIVVTETASNATGSSSLASSVATAVVASASGPPTAPSGTSPSATSAVVITGTVRVGETLSSTTGLWSGTPPLKYTYQWQRCNPGCSNIAGATASSYTLAGGDFGARIDVAVTAANSVGSQTMTSGAVGPAGPSVAQITGLLSKLLVPHGKTARIRALLAKGGYAFSFTTPGAGQLVVNWSRGSALVASVTVSFTKAGKVSSKLVLTLKGGHVLTGKGLARLTAKGTFTPSSLPATTVKKQIKLKG